MEKPFRIAFLQCHKSTRTRNGINTFVENFLAMCDSLGCSAEEKEMCLAHYGKDGKFIGGGKCEKEGACCADKKACKDPSKCKDKAKCDGACKH